MDDEPMWAADRVVALTPDSGITIPETIYEFAIKGSSKFDTDKIMALMDAMTMKKDAQYKELQSRPKEPIPDHNDDNTPLSREEEAKFMQTFCRTRFYNDYRDRDSNPDNWRSSGINDYNRDNYQSNSDDKPNLQKQLSNFIKVQHSTNSFVKNTFIDLKTKLETTTKNHQALILNLEAKFDRFAVKQSGQPSGSLPSNTQPNPKEEILEEDIDALLDEGSKILYSIEGTILEDKLFDKFDKFVAMTAEENSESEFDTEELPLKKITFNTDYKIKTYLEEPPTNLKLKPLPDNLEYAFLEEPPFLPVIISSYPWVSPIHCVPKKGGIIVVTNEKDKLVPTRTVTGWRVCIDYRKLDEATTKYHFPLPFIDQMLERLTGNKYVCFLDGFSSYFKIQVDPMDQEKTTFTCPFGTYAYRRMPFGLCNALATFQRCVLAIFHDMIKESIEVFMDDFSVFGNSFDYCLKNLDKMLQCCKDASLVLNWEKYHFMVEEEIMLGYKLSSVGLEVDKAKINIISKLPPPTNVKGIRSFLGHAGFYRSFIKYLSKISHPITKLLEKETPLEFNE
ncbi:reverse transcriptase domain-containing protein [Tanacetum coccineum]